jgi:hypothetical protein
MPTSSEAAKAAELLQQLLDDDVDEGAFRLANFFRQPASGRASSKNKL